MKVIVLGAGVVGVTTAYYLSQQGCEVTVIEREDTVATGASFANGGQLSYGFTDALAQPGLISSIPRMLYSGDTGARIRLAPALATWGLRFLSQCTNKCAASNTLAVLHAALRSAELMSELRTQLPFSFSHRRAGKLVLLGSDDELKAAKTPTEMKKQQGCDIEIVSRQEALRIEPALAAMTEKFIAAVYSSNDEVADARLFTVGLKDWLESCASVKFRFGATAQRLVTKKGCLQAVVIDGETTQADAVVVCLGAWSTKLLRSVGINPHIYPVRGYSVTLPLGSSPPSVSITAPQHRIVFSQFNQSMRIAGFLDFTGFDTRADAKRIGALLSIAEQVAPYAADYTVDEPQQWGGFRPMRPNGIPLTGATRIKGLFMNSGHGMLGWTLACSTAYDTAQAVTQAI